MSRWEYFWFAHGVVSGTYMLTSAESWNGIRGTAGVVMLVMCLIYLIVEARSQRRDI